MVLQVTLLGGCILAEWAKELPWVEVQFDMFFVVAPVGGLIVTVEARQRLWAVVNLPGMAGYLVLVGCQVGTALTLKGTLTYTQEEKRELQCCMHR